MTPVQESRWPGMIWIGGAPGAGKSTVAWQISRAYDLPLHPIDLWAYDHLARAPAEGSLDEELSYGSAHAAHAFLSAGQRRFRLVLSDVRARSLGRVPALVEGPQLNPGFATPLPKGHAVWLIPAPGLTRAAREERLAKVQDAAGRERLEGLLERDSLIAAWTLDAALRLDLPVVEVPVDPDWPAVRNSVESALAEALGRAPRLTGRQLRRQRRFENEIAARQGRLWREAAGLARTPAYAFACECGQPGCTLTWRASAEAYELQAADGPVLASDHDDTIA